MNQQQGIPAAKTHLALYFALTIPLAWTFWIPMILINRGIWTPPLSVATLVLSTLGAISPLLALGIIQRVTRRRVKLEEIFIRIRLKEMGTFWTLASPFIMMGIHLFTIVAWFIAEGFRGASPGRLQVFKPDVFSTLGWWIVLIIPVHFVPSLITSPLFEEPGWRGFAFENLRYYLPRDVASLIVGSYWWLWHQGMNLAFDLPPSLYGYLSMLLDSVAIDALYSLSRRNLLAAMLAHQVMGTVFMFLFPLPMLWYLLMVKLTAVAVLRYQVCRHAAAV